MKIGFIGCGKIAEPMIRSLCRQFPDYSIFVSHRSESISQALVEQFDNVLAGDNQWVIDNSDIVVLSVLANVARTEFPGLNFRDDQQMISVMADIDLAETAQLIAPATSVCVTIPLPYIETGSCPLPVFPASSVLQSLFASENEIIVQSSEKAMGPHFAATAILSTVMAQLDTVSNWLSEQTVEQKNAEKYVASLVSGYLGALEKDGHGRFLEAMQDLSTEGGLNTQLLNHNRDAGMLDTLNEGLQQLGKRLRGD